MSRPCRSQNAVRALRPSSELTGLLTQEGGVLPAEALAKAPGVQAQERPDEPGETGHGRSRLRKTQEGGPPLGYVGFQPGELGCRHFPSQCRDLVEAPT